MQTAVDEFGASHKFCPSLSVSDFSTNEVVVCDNLLCICGKDLSKSKLFVAEPFDHGSAATKSFIIALAPLIGWSHLLPLLGTPRNNYCIEKIPVYFMEDHAGHAAQYLDSEGTGLRRPEVNVPQRTKITGAPGTRAPEYDGAGASSPQRMMMAE